MLVIDVLQETFLLTSSMDLLDRGSCLGVFIESHYLNISMHICIIGGATEPLGIYCLIQSLCDSLIES